MIGFFQESYALLNVFILIVMIFCAIAVFYLKDLIAAAITFAAFSLLLALEFFILQAPDVAIAEASIGAGISTAIIIIAIRGTTHKESE
jgi:uncharacterized MnhB-related membrane protein